jgi:hypothetical protein
MAVVITGNNTPTAGGVVYGDGTTYATTSAGTAGYLLQSNGASAPSWVAVSAGYTLGTPITTSSGTEAEFTGIPSGVKQIVLTFNQVTFAAGANNNPAVQVSTSSAYLTSGYVGRMGTLRSTTVTPSALSTDIAIGNGSFMQAGDSTSGSLTMTLLDSTNNRWSGTAALSTNGSNSNVVITAFAFTLSGALNKVKLFDRSGNAFSSGYFNIAYL